MGKFVTIDNSNIVKYEAITDKPFGQILALEHILKFYKFQFFGVTKTSEVFFDTPNDLLNKAGVTLSKIQENDRAFFKVCQMTLDNKVKSTQRLFSHRIGPKDKLTDHSFYLVDGIRGIYSSPFYIDLEHVISNAVPKISISTSANVYKVISGTGFRALMTLETTVFENFETKRKHNVCGLTVKLDSPEQYEPEFKEFNQKITKYCKNFLEVNDNTFEHAKVVTQSIDKKQAKLDKKKAREKIAELKAEAKN